MEYRIKELCKQKCISINDLAEKVGIKRESISRIINGANTTTETLENISKVLEVSVNELFAEPTLDTFTCPNCGSKIKVSKP